MREGNILIEIEDKEIMHALVNDNMHISAFIIRKLISLGAPLRLYLPTVVVDREITHADYYWIDGYNRVDYWSMMDKGKHYWLFSKERDEPDD